MSREMMKIIRVTGPEAPLGFSPKPAKIRKNPNIPYLIHDFNMFSRFLDTRNHFRIGLGLSSKQKIKLNYNTPAKFFF